MTNYEIIGLISTLAISLSIIVILILRLGAYRNFPVLIIYLLIALCNNLFKQDIIPVNDNFERLWGLASNFLDIPLMLLFLAYFSPTKAFYRKLQKLIAVFILFETVTILIIGFNTMAVTVMYAPGLIIMMAMSFYFFFHYAKGFMYRNKGPARLFIAGSILFSYSLYTIIYLIYYVFRFQINKAGNIHEDTVTNIFMIYHLDTIFTAGLLITGLFYERKRVTQLQEVLVTRKELSLLYTNTKATRPFRKVMLDFDPDMLN